MISIIRRKAKAPDAFMRADPCKASLTQTHNLMRQILALPILQIRIQDSEK